MTESLTRNYETQESTETLTKTDSETRETPERIPFHSYPFVEEFLEDNNMDEKSFVSINKFFNVIERNSNLNNKSIIDRIDNTDGLYNNFLIDFYNKKTDIATKLIKSIVELSNGGNQEKLNKIQKFFEGMYGKFLKNQTLEEDMDNSLETSQNTHEDLDEKSENLDEKSENLDEIEKLSIEKANQIQEIILNNPEANQDLENKMQEQGIDLQDDEARLDFILNNPDVVLNLNGLSNSEIESIKGLYGNVDIVNNQSSHSPSEILEAKDSDNFQSCYSIQPLSTIEKSLLTHFKHYSQLISV